MPASSLSPQICGRWDAMHLWAQWEDVGGPYLFQWRWKQPGVDLTDLTDGKNAGDGWSPWQGVEKTGGLAKAWLVLPLWKPRMCVQARVAVQTAEAREILKGKSLPRAAVDYWAAVEALPWELGREVTFQKSRCGFAIVADRRARPLLLPKGSELHQIVDGAPCIYVLAEQVEVLPGGRVEVEGEAVGLSGFHQLDKAGDFHNAPRLGITVDNLGPSVNDTAATGRDFTVMESLPGQPLRMTFSARRVL